MKIINEYTNHTVSEEGLKEVLVFNYEGYERMYLVNRLVSYSFSDESLAVYGATLKGIWKIKQLQKELEKLNK